jgi:two-component SAPR family response regulator
MANKQRATKRINILIVDDDEAVLNFFKRLLKEDVYNVTTADTGQGALDEIGRGDFDLVFLDIVLRDINGIEVCSKIREIKPDLDIILITGYPEKEKDTEHLDIKGCFFKPFGIDKIFSEIDRIKHLKGL